MTSNGNLPITAHEIRNLQSAAESEAGLQRMLKFKRGEFMFGDEYVDLGTEYVAHPVGWTKVWVKFVNKQFIERRVFRVISSPNIPDRSELGDMDSSKWGPGLQGEHSDPWTLQNMLPLEDPQTGEIVVFYTPSRGGQIAVAELCGTYSRRYSRDSTCGLPVVSLQTTKMKTGQYGLVDRPVFKIERWAKGSGEQVREIEAPTTSSDMDDDIPF